MSTSFFEVRNNFLIGNFQAAINAADTFKPENEQEKLMKDVYVYRSMIALGDHFNVLQEVAEDSAPELQAVRLLASLKEEPDAEDSVIAQAKKLMSDGVAATSWVVQLLCATIYFSAKNPADALRCVRGSDELEPLLLSVQLYLHLQRPDLAEKEVKAMEKKDDYATESQLAQAWLNLVAGGEKVQDAYFIFNELSEKNAPTPMLLNSMAVCNIHMQKFEEAEEDLLLALERDNKNPDTLSNLIIVGQHRGKSAETINRYLKQLAKVAPDHAWLESVNLAKQQFEREQDKFAP